MRFGIYVFRAFLLLWLLASCAGQQTRSRSSVVDYLYPGKEEAAIEAAIPVLHVPLKVAIAFVPEQRRDSRGRNIWTGRATLKGLTEVDKNQLLEKVAENFRAYDFVSDIEVIPSAYLTAGGSFQNLDQIRTMYGVDVIALVSYDQVQFTDEGMLSLTYWTLVGAYVIAGEKNDTSTMLDTVVYDIPSRKMLFRAPGTSRIKGRATPVNLSEELRADSLKGFHQAVTAMIGNLDRQLQRFKEKLKRNPEAARIVYRSGGGGIAGPIECVAMIMLASLILQRRRS